jgi:hypothetical protein
MSAFFFLPAVNVLYRPLSSLEHPSIQVHEPKKPFT